MSRANTGNGSNYLYSGSAVLATRPLTLVCWARLSNVSHTASLLNITDTSGSEYYSLVADGANEYGGGAGRIIADPGQAGTFPISTTAYTANTWFHAAGVFSAPTSRAVYLNGGSKATNTISRTTGTPTTTSLGGFRVTGTTYGPMDGEMAHAAVYNIALTDAEVLLLAKGYLPTQVRPDALVAYWPLNSGPQTIERSLVGSGHLTLFGSMRPGTSEPSLIVPRNFHREWLSEPSAGGDVSVSLTGQSVTTSAGSLKSAIAQAVAGQSVTIVHGSLKSGLAYGVTGQSATLFAGSITEGIAYSLAGQSVTASAGTIIPARSVALSGQSLTTSAGTLTSAIGETLSGQSVTVSQGNVSTGSDVVISLTGQSITASAGSVKSALSRALSGSAATLATGTLRGTVAYSLSGMAATTAAGTLSVDISRTLSGLSLTTSAGTMGKTGGDVVASGMPPYITVYMWKRTA